mgnify:CR=1 FL=1
MHFDTGEKYRLADLFTDDADYIGIISANIQAQLNERNLIPALFEPFDQIRADQYYYLSNLGVTVYFQQYDILPYAAGIQEFTIDFLSLAHLLKNPEIFIR